MIYKLDSLWLPHMSVNERYQDDLGKIVVGGDKGDVYAKYAENKNGGVLLSDVELHWGFNITLTDDEIYEEIDQIVSECWDSIGEDTFIPTKNRKAE